jgi:hypothetical protein
MKYNKQPKNALINPKSNTVASPIFNMTKTATPSPERCESAEFNQSVFPKTIAAMGY